MTRVIIEPKIDAWYTVRASAWYKRPIHETYTAQLVGIIEAKRSAAPNIYKVKDNNRFGYGYAVLSELIREVQV